LFEGWRRKYQPAKTNRVFPFFELKEGGTESAYYYYYFFSISRKQSCGSAAGVFDRGSPQNVTYHISVYLPIPTTGLSLLIFSLHFEVDGVGRDDGSVDMYRIDDLNRLDTIMTGVLSPADTLSSCSCLCFLGTIVCLLIMLMFYG
jgi:hypothetical protein